VIFVKKRPQLFALLLICALAAVIGLRLATRVPPERPGKAAEPASPSGPDSSLRTAAREAAGRGSPATDPVLAAALQKRLRARDARPRETVLSFRDADAYRRFLERARAAGLTVISKNDALLSVRVGFDALGGLQRDLVDHAPDYTDLGPNHLVHVPGQPPAEERAAHPQIPFGATMLNFLGVAGTDTSRWGLGTTIAVLDSGISGDATFGAGRIRYLDIGLGVAPGRGPEDGHGTAVAALAAGAGTDAKGVAPSADLLSIRVTDGSGESDMFTLSQGITAAVDSGARIINISLGGYGTSLVLDRAIDYATSRGAVIVAAAGNDQAAQLAWPAADPRVISVGAVDAAEQQVLFSNSGPQLKITAPGYAVQTAWLDSQRVTMSGTSASAPIVAGSIAAMMSQNPGFTAPQAWQVLQQYSSDAGSIGADPNYGSGILNLGWAMSRNDASRVDTAVSGEYYNAAAQTMEFVVQNRSTRGIGSLTLDVTASGTLTSYPITWLAAGASTVVKIPITGAQLAPTGQIDFRASLLNPFGLTDQIPANNQKSVSVGVPTE
jgi:hypothetical protein